MAGPQANSALQVPFALLRPAFPPISHLRNWGDHGTMEPCTILGGSQKQAKAAKMGSKGDRDAEFGFWGFATVHGREIGSRPAARSSWRNSAGNRTRSP